ncbi:MAG: cytochrome o ubiquinol oxidase subunit IV [Pseudomonadota bacterium]
MSLDAHALEEPDHAHHDDGPPHGTLQSYLIGFGLSVVLTAIPFWLIMSGVIANKAVAAVTVMAFAFVQIIVHVIYFLHVDFKSERGWTIMTFLFTVIILFITLSGSLWVMYHLTSNMAPTTAVMRQMP